MFIKENLFENVVCKMAAILSWPPCVNKKGPGDKYLGWRAAKCFAKSSSISVNMEMITKAFSLYV